MEGKIFKANIMLLSIFTECQQAHMLAYVDRFR